VEKIQSVKDRLDMTRKVILVCLLTLFAAVPSIGQQSSTTAAKPRFGTWGADLTAMDRSVKPGDSFWHFVNGSWDRRTEIPADRTNAGASVLLVEEAERQVRAIVEDLARDPSRGGPAGRQVGDFYASWMDVAGVEANGTGLLKPYLSKIDAVRNRSDLLKLFATPGFATPVEIGIIPDPADPTRYVAAAGEGSLGLPSRDFYLLTGERYDAIRAAYRT
jgi:predicted metalloendopeptidase